MTREEMEAQKAGTEIADKVNTQFKAALKRRQKCGAGPLGNCGYYGCATPRETCPLKPKQTIL